MANIKIQWTASEKLVRQELVREGKSQNRTRFLVVNLEDLLPATRERLLNIAPIGPSHDQQGRIHLVDMDLTRLPMFDHEKGCCSHTPVDFDAVPSLDQVLDTATRIQAAGVEVRLLCEKAQAEADAQKRLQQAVLAKAISELELYRAAGDLDAIKRYPVLHLGLTDCDRRELGFRIRQFVRELQQAIEEQAQREWIRQYGSRGLQRILEQECGVLYLYLIERAAKEAPGFTLDINDTATWTGCDYPTDEAFAEMERAESLGLGRARIVWLSCMPNDAEEVDDSVMDVYEQYQYPEIHYEPIEAVVIRNYLGRYNLVKPLG